MIAAQEVTDQRRPRQALVRTANILTALGALVFFASWAAQNYLEPRWAARVSHLETTQTLIQIERLNREMWQIQYNLELTMEERSDRTGLNRERMVEVAYNYLDATQNIFFWESHRVAQPKGQAELPESKERVRARMDELYLKRDLAGLDEMVRHYDGLLSEKQRELDAQFGARIRLVRERAESWNRVFLAGYVLGSLLIAVRWGLLVGRGDR